MDFLWKSKLKVEQEEVETMGGINKILLENILPAHVAHHFLEGRKKTDVNIEFSAFVCFILKNDTWLGENFSLKSDMHLVAKLGISLHIPVELTWLYRGEFMRCFPVF